MWPECLLLPPLVVFYDFSPVETSISDLFGSHRRTDPESTNTNCTAVGPLGKLNLIEHLLPDEIIIPSLTYNRVVKDGKAMAFTRQKENAQ